jgi:hypothetical protein
MVAQAPILVPGAAPPDRAIRVSRTREAHLPATTASPPVARGRPMHAERRGSRWREARLPMARCLALDCGTRGSRFQEARVPKVGGAAPDGGKRASRRREARLPMPACAPPGSGSRAPCLEGYRSRRRSGTSGASEMHIRSAEAALTCLTVRFSANLDRGEHLRSPPPCAGSRRRSFSLLIRLRPRQDQPPDPRAHLALVRELRKKREAPPVSP